MADYHPNPEFDTVMFSYAAGQFRDVLAEHYGLPRLADLATVVEVSEMPDDTLERVTERSYSIIEPGEEGIYSLNVEDYSSFSNEVDEAFPERPDTDQIARSLFVGLGVAGTALAEMLQTNIPAPLKKRTHAQMLRDFFASHDGVEEALRVMFTDKLRERAEMSDGMYDARAMSINGLRLRLRILFDAVGHNQLIPVRYDELILRAREHIPQLYKNESTHYCDVMVMSLGQSPKKGDQMFFATLPDWLIAAAAPLRPQEFQHFHSPAWRKN